jgi:hypothetical protein
MDEKFDQAFQQAAVFQQLWTDSFTKMAEAWGKFSPGKPPPDAIREIRTEMLKVLTETWDQFMRTPQFMEYMKNSMEGFLNLRQFAAEALTRNHHEMQAPAREDIDGVLLAIRHMERRLLDRIEEIENAVGAIGPRLDRIEESAHEPVGVAAREPTTTETGEESSPDTAPARKAPRRRAK